MPKKPTAFNKMKVPKLQKLLKIINQVIFGK